MNALYGKEVGFGMCVSPEEPNMYPFTWKTHYHFDYLPMREKPDLINFLMLYQAGDLCAESGFQIGQHVQYCHEISYIESGAGKFCVNGRWFDVNKGDIILCRKNDLHDGMVDLCNPMRMFYLGFDIVNGQDAEPPLCDIMPLWKYSRGQVITHNHSEVAPFFIGIFQELLNREAQSEHMIGAYALQLLISIQRAFYGSDIPCYSPVRDMDLNGKLVHQIIKYIDTHYTHLDNLTQISKDLGYSYSHLAHVFKNKMGISIYDYYDRKRFDRTLEMLRQGQLSITEIAEAAGYQSVHAFSKAFNKRYGISPSEYAVMYRHRTKY